MDTALASSLAIGYLLGAIPVGIFAGRALGGIDPRDAGSRNIGFTNVLRVAGNAAGIVTLIGDIGKGALAVLVARHLVGAAGSEWELAAGGAAILGHIFPVFLRFKGGKGVATALGVLLAVDWVVGASVLVVWLMSAAIWRISSLAALLAFGSLPLWVWLFHPSVPVALFALGAIAMLGYRHRDNIQRLLDGTETTIGAR